MFAIRYYVNSEGDCAYVKWRKKVVNGVSYWDVTPVETFTEASKYKTRSGAERAIKGVDAFNGSNSITAVVASD